MTGDIKIAGNTGHKGRSSGYFVSLENTAPTQTVGIKSKGK